MKIIMNGSDVYLSSVTKKDVKDGELIIPEGVTRITDHLTFYRADLKRLILPESLKVIEQGTFSGCVNLEKINIPKSLEYIGVCAFEGCKCIKKDKNGFNTIGKWLISVDDSENDTIEVPNNIIGIASQIDWKTTHFRESGNVKIIIPKNVKFICKNISSLSQKCSNTEVHYKGTLKDWCKIQHDETIKAYDLYIDEKLITDVDLTNINKVTNYAFSGSNIHTIKLGKAIPEILETLCAECKVLYSFDFGDELVTANLRIFNKTNYSLKTITLGKNIQLVLNDKLNEDIYLNYVEIINNGNVKTPKRISNTKVVSTSKSLIIHKDGFLFVKDGDTLKLIGNTNVSNILQLPEMDTPYVIDTKAIKGSIIKEIIVPKSVIGIKEGAIELQTPDPIKIKYLGTLDNWLKMVFGMDYGYIGSWCNFKYNLYFNDELFTELTTDKEVPDKAFTNCCSLLTANINNQSIGKYAFSECINLYKLEFGDNVIAAPELNLYCCNNLRSIRFGKNTVLGECNQLYNIIDYLIEIRAPENIISAWKQHNYNNRSYEIYYLGSDAESRLIKKGNFIFYNNDSIISLVAMFDNYTEISHYNASEIKLPDIDIPTGKHGARYNISSVFSHSIFYNCNTLVIPHVVDIVETGALRGILAKNLIIEEGVIQINNAAVSLYDIKSIKISNKTKLFKDSFGRYTRCTKAQVNYSGTEMSFMDFYDGILSKLPEYTEAKSTQTSDPMEFIISRKDGKSVTINVSDNDQTTLSNLIMSAVKELLPE